MLRPCFHCAKTVPELDPFHPKTFLFERKQIPRIVVIIRNSRQPREPLEPISLPWAQGVRGSNPRAPTITRLFLNSLRDSIFHRSRNLCALVCTSRETAPEWPRSNVIAGRRGIGFATRSRRRREGATWPNGHPRARRRNSAPSSPASKKDNKSRHRDGCVLGVEQGVPPSQLAKAGRAAVPESHTVVAATAWIVLISSCCWAGFRF